MDGRRLHLRTLQHAKLCCNTSRQAFISIREHCGWPATLRACAGELRSAMYGRATVCPPSGEQSPSTEARTPTHPTALPERVLQAAEVSMQSMPLSSAVSKGSREVSHTSHRSWHGIRQRSHVTAHVVRVTVLTAVTCGVFFAAASALVRRWRLKAARLHFSWCAQVDAHGKPLKGGQRFNGGGSGKACPISDPLAPYSPFPTPPSLPPSRPPSLPIGALRCCLAALPRHSRTTLCCSIACARLSDDHSSMPPQPSDL